MLARGNVVPCVRTIARVLARHGVVRIRRVRRPPPPPGWYLPDLASGRAELDAFDFVEGLAFSEGRGFDALTAISLWGSLAGVSVLVPGKCLPLTLAAMAEHWQACDLPAFVQFDNDSIFQGSHGHPTHLGRVVHFCLCLGVVPIFTPPRETGFQNKLESFNALWQDKVWHRHRHRDYAQLRVRNTAFLKAHRCKHAAQFETAPARRKFSGAIPQTTTTGRVIWLRRADARGLLQLSGRSFHLPTGWAHRLLRCEWQMELRQLTVFGLHRRQPENQPLLLRTPLIVKLTPWSSPPR
jgi:hypothetical protein